MLLQMLRVVSNKGKHRHIVDGKLLNKKVLLMFQYKEIRDFHQKHKWSEKKIVVWCGNLVFFVIEISIPFSI